MFETFLLVRAADATGVSPAVTLDGSRICPSKLADASVRVSARQRLRVYENILANCTDPEVFLRAGNSATVCSFGVWGYVLLSSSTFLDATRIAFKYLKLTGPLVRKTFDIEQELAFFEADDRLVLGHLLPSVLEFWFALIDKLSKEVSQRAFELERVELTYPPPAHAASYRDFFGCDVRFEADRNRVCFDAGMLDLPLPRADALTLQVCEEMCATMVDQMQYAAGPAKQVRDLIMASPNAYPSLEEIAGEMFTTPRTLRRRLAGQGTSYQRILNEVRKNLAMRFLRETDLSMEEIAERVGFSDSRNFRQAFKRWTDTTPSSHRARG